MKSMTPVRIISHHNGSVKIESKPNYYFFAKLSMATLLVSMVLFLLHFLYQYVSILYDEHQYLTEQVAKGDIPTNVKRQVLEEILSDIIFEESKIPHPIAQKYVTWILDSSIEYKVDPLLILSVMSVESMFNSKAVSSGNAIGLMQVIYSWHKEKVRSKNDLFDPKTNIFVGTHVLKEYLMRSKTETEALLRYSGSLGQSPVYAIKVNSTKNKYYLKIMKKLTHNLKK